MNEVCPKCKGMKHLMEPAGTWKRCDCLVQEIRQQLLGVMYTENPMVRTSLEEYRDQNLVLSGPLESIRKHVARVLLTMAERQERWVTMDAYRLIEIFLDQDKEFDSTAVAVDCDLFLLLLGFGDPRNRYLPELILQALNRRALTRKPTWVALGLPQEQVGTKYSSELQGMLDGWQKVQVAVK